MNVFVNVVFKINFIGFILVILVIIFNSVRYGFDVILVVMIILIVFVNFIKWQKVLLDGNFENLDIILFKYIQNGVGLGIVILIIKNVIFIDGGSYQVEVSNVVGNIGKSEKVLFSVKGIIRLYIFKFILYQGW